MNEVNKKKTFWSIHFRPKSGSVVCFVLNELKVKRRENLHLALNWWNILLGGIFDTFGPIKREDEKFSHQSDWTWHRQGPSDWMFNYWHWLMSRRRQHHPPLATAPTGQFVLGWNSSWIVGRHGQSIREKYKSGSLFKCIRKKKWQQLSCCEWADLRSPRRYPLRWTCALRHNGTDSLQLAPAGHFISLVKDSLTSLSLNAPCTATSAQQPVRKTSNKQ